MEHILMEYALNSHICSLGLDLLVDDGVAVCIIRSDSLNVPNPQQSLSRSGRLAFQRHYIPIFPTT